MLRTARHARLDYPLLIALLALLAIGLPAIFSASHESEGWRPCVKQLIFAGIGLGGLLVLACIDYRIWARHWRLLLVVTLVALFATLFVPEINGAHSWIDLGPVRLQTSEFAKLALILAFASWLTRTGSAIRTLPRFLRTLAFIGAPALLILAQPDFGTAMVLCAIWLLMVLIADARWWMVLAVVLGAVLLFAVAWQLNLIKQYQKRRMDFIHANPATTGYHQRQARIAIGAGEFWGKGYLQNTQSTRGFLPEQKTDFIFAVIGEEFGFVGAISILALYLFILWRLLRMLEAADTRFGRYIIAGVVAMLGTHIFINIGMCLTLSPVTGVPLPLISYGGSNLLTNLLAFGIVLNISRHRESQHKWAGEETLVRL